MSRRFQLHAYSTKFLPILLQKQKSPNLVLNTKQLPRKKPLPACSSAATTKPSPNSLMMTKIQSSSSNGLSTSPKIGSERTPYGLYKVVVVTVAVVAMINISRGRRNRRLQHQTNQNVYGAYTSMECMRILPTSKIFLIRDCISCKREYHSGNGASIIFSNNGTKRNKRQEYPHNLPFPTSWKNTGHHPLQTSRTSIPTQKKAELPKRVFMELHGQVKIRSGRVRFCWYWSSHTKDDKGKRKQKKTKKTLKKFLEKLALEDRDIDRITIKLFKIVHTMNYWGAGHIHIYSHAVGHRRCTVT